MCSLTRMRQKAELDLSAEPVKLSWRQIDDSGVLPDGATLHLGGKGRYAGLVAG
jgi:hypothetical protein